jgi:hypothetical protein
MGLTWHIMTIFFGKLSGSFIRNQDTNQFPFTGEDPKVVAALRAVARIFAQLQEQRHIADYDNTTLWTRTAALDQVKSRRARLQFLASDASQRVFEPRRLGSRLRRRMLPRFERSDPQDPGRAAS